MLLCAQFPLADVRPFLREESRSVPSPAAFVRRAGTRSSRRGGGTLEWPADTRYWRAHSTVRYADSLDQRSFGAGRKAGFRGAFRRLYWDKTMLPSARLELGIANTGGGRARSRRPMTAPAFGAAEGRTIVRDFLEMPVAIASHGVLGKHSLNSGAEPLARLLLESTTRFKGADGFQPQGWWVRPGKPMFMVEYGFSEQGEPPAQARLVAEESSVTLHFLREEIDGRSLPVWWLGVHDAPWNPEIRLLRLHLLRIHAELQTLLSVLELIADVDRCEDFAADGPRSSVFDAYLRKAVGLLSREAHYGFETADVLESAYGYHDEIAAGDLVDIKALIERAAEVRPVLASLQDPENQARQVVDTIWPSL
jgi:hypothetical protein